MVLHMYCVLLHVKKVNNMFYAIKPCLHSELLEYICDVTFLNSVMKRPIKQNIFSLLDVMN